MKGRESRAHHKEEYKKEMRKIRIFFPCTLEAKGT
jgi:hypothetical protein